MYISGLVLEFKCDFVKLVCPIVIPKQGGKRRKREVEVEVTINFPIFRRRRVWFYSNDSKSLREADLEASFGSLYGYKSRPWNLKVS